MNNFLVRIFKDPFILAYVILYFVLIVALHITEGFSIILPIVVFLILGAGFSALAWWTTRGVEPLTYSVKQPASECALLAVCLIIITFFITWGLNFIETTIHAEPLKSITILVAKVIVFVLIPLLLFRGIWKYTLHDLLSFTFGGRKHLRVILWMSLVLISFQAVLGRGLSEIRASGLPWWSWVLGIPCAFVWLVLEAGLVEEFFFRTLIQSRVAAFLKSEAAGIVVMSVLFGLAHAPGMYVRTSKTLEALGPSPSLFMALGYSIVVTSVAGFFLGVLWVRTKSITVLMLVHAAGDLLPSAAGILTAWLR